MLMRLVSRGIEGEEINYYLGVCCSKLGLKQESGVYFESCLTTARDVKLAMKALKCILREAIDAGNFYEAEHQINRVQQFGFQEEAFKEWRLFVEGVSDLIKRKNVVGCSKLEKAVEIVERVERGSHRNSETSVRSSHLSECR
jgi:hypothetical protein